VFLFASCILHLLFFGFSSGLGCLVRRCKGPFFQPFIYLEFGQTYKAFDWYFSVYLKHEVSGVGGPR
jgi:hypothetical protein